MRGLMQKPQKKITGAVGEIIENPIISNFKDGLSGLEYFISTHGARKGLADTALKTADAGYLTRRLVDVVQDVVVSEEDCGTTKGIEVVALTEGDEVIEPLWTRLLGRTTQEDVFDPVSDELICPINMLIDETLAKKIEAAGIESVQIRSVLTCDSRAGVCRSCYGRNLATGKRVDIGEAMGIIAAQSIGDRHAVNPADVPYIGGTASLLIAQSKESSKIDGVVRVDHLESVAHKNGTVAMNRAGKLIILDAEERERYRYTIPYGSFLKVKDGQKVAKGQVVYEWDPSITSFSRPRADDRLYGSC